MALDNVSISRFSPRTQLILFGVIIAGLCLVFYTYYVGPLRTEVVAINADIERLHTEIQEGEAVKAQLPRFKKMVEQQRRKLAQLKQILPDQKETAEIVRRVQELAVESKLRIKSFTPQKTINNDFYEDWPILISLEGSYNNLGAFFEKVSEFTRIINVEDISINALEESSNSKTIGATCTATTFVFLEDEISDSVASEEERRNEIAAAF